MRSYVCISITTRVAEKEKSKCCQEPVPRATARPDDMEARLSYAVGGFAIPKANGSASDWAPNAKRILVLPLLALGTGTRCV